MYGSSSTSWRLHYRIDSTPEARVKRATHPEHDEEGRVRGGERAAAGSVTFNSREDGKVGEMLFVQNGVTGSVVRSR